jgi:Mg-chelatase subunit ChlD
MIADNDVFISYSHADLGWLKRLQVHLKPLHRDGIISLWDDTRLTPGSQWRKEIQEALNRARIAVLLVSADFLASDFITTNELPPLLAAAEQRGTLILPLLVSPCRFEQTASLSRFQAVNPPSEPLIRMRKAKREEIFVKVSRLVEQAFAHAPQPPWISGLSAASGPQSSNDDAERALEADHSHPTSSLRQEDIRGRIVNVAGGIAEVEEYRPHLVESKYQLHATSRTPALVIYVVDTSGSMAEHFEAGTTRVNAIRTALQSLFTSMKWGSSEGTVISPSFRVAVFAYSDVVHDVLSGFQSIAHVAQFGLPAITPQTGTDTARAFRAVETLLEQELPKLGNHPAPLVCHITDGQFTGEDPTPVARRIMQMSVPDGQVLLQHICMATDVLGIPVPRLSDWTGARVGTDLAGYGRTLFDISSALPESYRRRAGEMGYSLAPGARMVVPGFTRDLLELGLAISTAVSRVPS